MKKTKLSEERAGKFYEVHKERPFYQDLVKYMSSGPIVAAILEKDNAVADFRTLIGATNPAQAALVSFENRSLVLRAVPERAGSDRVAVAGGGCCSSSAPP